MESVSPVVFFITAWIVLLLVSGAIAFVLYRLRKEYRDCKQPELIPWEEYVEISEKYDEPVKKYLRLLIFGTVLFTFMSSIPFFLKTDFSGPLAFVFIVLGCFPSMILIWVSGASLGKGLIVNKYISRRYTYEPPVPSINKDVPIEKVQIFHD